MQLRELHAIEEQYSTNPIDIIYLKLGRFFFSFYTSRFYEY